MSFPGEEETGLASAHSNVPSFTSSDADGMRHGNCGLTAALASPALRVASRFLRHCTQHATLKCTARQPEYVRSFQGKKRRCLAHSLLLSTHHQGE